MPSFQTLFRAAVMVVIGVVGFKAWKLYGPTNEQVKATTARVIELVQSSIESRQQAPTAAADPRTAPRAAAVPPTSPLSPAPGVNALSQPEAPRLLPRGETPALAPNQPSPPAEKPPVKTADQPAVSSDRTPELLKRLQQLGAADTNLVPWGGNGNMYRFSCEAPLPSAPLMMQQFESVASEPAAAIEQVLAKVEASKVARRDGTTLRY
jgi:hypothetical protein